MSQLSFREKLEHFFNSNTISNTLYQIFINGLIFVSIIFLLAEHRIAYVGLNHSQLILADIAIATIFSVDYIFRFYASPHRGRFVINIYNIIDLIAIVPSFIVLFLGIEASTASVRAARFIRFLRFLRIARFFRVVRLIHTIDQKFKDDYRKDSEASEEADYYHQLLQWYLNLKESPKKETDMKELNKLIALTKEIMKHTDNKIAGKANILVIEEKQNFYLAYYELLSQITAVLQRFGTQKTNWNLMKLEYLVKETGVLLHAEHTKGTIEQVPEVKLTKSMHFLRLLMMSLRDVLIIFSVGVALNVIIKLTPIYSSSHPFLDQQLPIIEAGMAALIVFITSFNLSYTNSKRANTDISIIEFMNLLAIYSERLRSLIEHKEKDKAKQKQLYGELNHYFESIGFDILNGVKQGNKYHLKFDTVITQCLDRINYTIGLYLDKVDDVSRNEIARVQGKLLGALNTFQTLSNIRAAVIFNALNHWIIQITYFILISLSSYAALPRIFFVFLMQRAFYNTANETDSAIFNVSLSKLPVEDRVLRRICRISSVLS